MNVDALEREILARIRPPQIPNYSLNICRCGAVPGARTPQTAAIQQAIDRVAAAGGGRVEVPRGVFLTGALRLRSHVELHLQSPASVLRFLPRVDTGDYPVVFSHWEGTPCYNYSALLYACDETDLAVTGPGVLDGQGRPDTWWSWHHEEENPWSTESADLQAPARRRLRRMNLEGVPVEQRRFGDGDYLRPNFVQFLRCERVLLKEFTMRHSPMWNLNPVLCRSVVIRGLCIDSHGPNSDGCDPESCDGVLIENCFFDNGDDCISLKSGRDRDGRILATPCRNVLIRHNFFADGHGGIALGSEMSGGLCRIVARGNRFDSPNLTYALRLKSNARRGRVVEQVVLADSDIRTVSGAAVHGTMMYEDGPDGDNLPVFRDILIQNVTAHGGEYGIFLEAFSQVPITGLELRHIHIDGVTHPLWAQNWKDPVLEDVFLNGRPYPRPYGVHILGIPAPGAELHAASNSCVPGTPPAYRWQFCPPGGAWRDCGTGTVFRLSAAMQAGRLRLWAINSQGCGEQSMEYHIVPPPEPGAAPGTPGSAENRRLQARGMLPGPTAGAPDAPIRRRTLASMLEPMLSPVPGLPPLESAIVQGVMARQGDALAPNGFLTREELATVAMSCCAANYRNASTTRPHCADADRVSPIHATQVARALYFGFMKLDERGRFDPDRRVTMAQAVCTLNAVADFNSL
ncbi:glycoside hydrolase family 28 protein [Gemmiger formicilis]|uniref:glycoside hydrolase family 28 protein n=1 Tax=Gemmiger formicilis TaxID=745368 RepID=UPI001956E94E|nr:glycoside hydrolase family 28 protein [Gemmiger formicilis]MBM6715342.1 glycoside hydrolase family 28 protein [Gemmiger formicilis]